MNSSIRLRLVKFVPKTLEENILYVSKRFKVAAHKCPCGCESKIITPLGPCEWAFTKKRGKPTLHPSIGNWQLPCRSHYWIIDGKIKWSFQLTDEEIEAGRKEEQERRASYFKKRHQIRKKYSWTNIKNRITNM